MKEKRSLKRCLDDSASETEVIVLPSYDVESGEITDIRQEDQPKKTITDYATMLFGSDFNRTEVKFVLFATCLISLNTGFVNGVTMSGLLISAEPTTMDPDRQMIAGFAGSYTNTAISLVGHDWETYRYHLYMILSYMGGAFISAMISPHAKSWVIEPRYGPTFMVGGTMLLGACLLAKGEWPSRYVFFLATASNGLQNGIASIYSANLIRCTLTGATTDIAIVIAQCIHGNYKGLARGMVLTAIVFFFWCGGIISFWAIREFMASTLLCNAVLFYMVGSTLVYYLVKEVGVSVQDALFGTWKWKKVLKKLDTIDGDLTRDKLMDIFDTIDNECKGNGYLDADELRDGLRRAKIKMKNYEMKTLFRAADDNGDGFINRGEWEELTKKIL